MPTWVVVAESGTQEAFAPVTDFARNLVISSAVLALVVSVISLILARILVSPFRRLSAAAKRIAAGETNVTVDAGRSDEVVQVATAFNEMSRSLQVKADLLDQQSEETERLLRSLMPEPVIRRYREGATTIAEDHRAVSVMFADIVGFEEYSRDLDSQQTLERLNELVTRFDDAGAQLGVEHVRTTTKGYLASCGLTVPRVDNARRMVEFALELESILARYSAQWGTTLRLRAGIDVGDLTSGLVGQSHMIYDLWGEAVNLAFRLQGDHHDSGIFLTERVLEGLPERPPLVEAGSIESDGTHVAVWRIGQVSHD
jgi:class 3 adenylate cyclase